MAASDLSPLTNNIQKYTNTQNSISQSYQNKMDGISQYNNYKNRIGVLSAGDSILDINPRDIQMKKTTGDIKNEDVKQLILQENSLFSIGVITCATLLIAGIFISKSNEA